MESWVERLIKEYGITKRDLERYRKTLDRSNLVDQEEHKIIGGMISDLQFALEWMKRGRRPGNRRGAERRSVYQRTVLLDTELFPSLLEDEPERSLTDWEKRKLIDLLWELSDRERQCYLLHMAHGRSMLEIAKELGISKRTVQQYIDRAKEKIKKNVS